MLLSNLCSSLVLALAFTTTIVGSLTTAYEGHELSPRGEGDPERKIYIQFKFNYQKKLFDDTGIEKFPGHSALWISGTDKSGPIQIELYSAGDRDSTAKPDRPLEIRVMDKTTQNSHEPPRNFQPYQSLEHGVTTMTNDELVDPKTGEGAILEAWKQFGSYMSGPDNVGKLNTCHNFVQILLKLIPTKPQVPSPDAQKHFDTYDRYSVDKKYNEYNFNRKLTAMNVFNPNKDPAKKIEPELKKRFTADEVGCSRRLKAKRAPCSIKLTPTDDIPSVKGQNEFALVKWTEDLPAEDLDITADDQSPSKAIPDAEQARKVTIVRNKGEVKRFTSFSKGALSALGVAGDVVGAVFIILDLVHKEWQAAGVGAISLAAGIAGILAFAGPVGWIVGGVAAALFAILPGTGVNRDLPERKDVQGIVQFKMFGDKAHTGSEKCKEGNDDTPGNKDCQALFGAGTLSMALGMSNFDTIVFLTHFNDGYAMSTAEIAKAFYVVDETKDGDGSDKMATITCHPQTCPPNPPHGCLESTDIEECKDPTFAINRKNIKLDTFDQTADKLYSRILPNKGGDCKLVTYPGDMKYPDYDLTISGEPSAIACGIKEGINLQGNTLDNDAIEEGPASDGDQSTTGQDGAYVKPPPATPFAPLPKEKFLCIYKDGEKGTCWPPGTYSSQGGLGFESKTVNSVSLPENPGWSLTVHWKHGGMRMRMHRRDPAPLPDRPTIQPVEEEDKVFDKNVNPKADENASDDLLAYMEGVANGYDKKGTFTVKAPGDGPEPICCLFSEVDFVGNALCLGLGGGDLPPQWKKVPQSVSCHAGGAVWIYAEKYGDGNGAEINGEVKDLASQLYGPDDKNFAKNVVAAWVKKA